VACQWGRQCLHHMMPHQRAALCVGSCPPRVVAVEASAGQHLLRGAHCNGFALTPSGANHDDAALLAMCMFVPGATSSHHAQRNKVSFKKYLFTQQLACVLSG